jgi:hypothetical protein
MILDNFTSVVQEQRAASQRDHEGNTVPHNSRISGSREPIQTEPEPAGGVGSRSEDARARGPAGWAPFDCSQCGSASRAQLGTERAERRVCKDCFGKREDRRPRELNELTGKEWAQRSRSVSEYPDTRSEKQKYH